MKSPLNHERTVTNDILRESLKALPRIEADSPEAIRKQLLAFCEKEINRRLKTVRAGQAVALTLIVEVVNEDYSFESENPRSSPKVAEWRTAVFERDGYACRDCGANRDIQAHHIEEWAAAPSRRFDVDNGLTLCKEHHADRHPPTCPPYPEQRAGTLTKLTI